MKVHISKVLLVVIAIGIAAVAAISIYQSLLCKYIHLTSNHQTYQLRDDVRTFVTAKVKIDAQDPMWATVDKYVKGQSQYCWQSLYVDYKTPSLTITTGDYLIDITPKDVVFENLKEHYIVGRNATPADLEMRDLLIHYFKNLPSNR